MSDWRDQGLCAYVDPDLWYPEKGESARPAKRICARCPVQPQCLADALAEGERFGVWGGLSERERRQLTAEREFTLQAERAREHARVITSLPNPEAARELDVTPRTVQRWRAVLREAS